MDKHEAVKKAMENFKKRTKSKNIFETDIPEGEIGGLHICTKCYNVHRPGPCMNLGISPDDFAKRKKKELELKL